MPYINLYTMFLNFTSSILPKNLFLTSIFLLNVFNRLSIIDVSVYSNNSAKLSILFALYRPPIFIYCCKLKFNVLTDSLNDINVMFLSINLWCNPEDVDNETAKLSVPESIRALSLSLILLYNSSLSVINLLNLVTSSITTYFLSAIKGSISAIKSFTVILAPTLMFINIACE